MASHVFITTPCYDTSDDNAGIMATFNFRWIWRNDINENIYPYLFQTIHHLEDQNMLFIWVRSPRCGCLVTWFCYQLIAKPGNKLAAPPWPDSYRPGHRGAAVFLLGFAIKVDSKTSSPFYEHGLTLIPAWISNYIHYKVWDEITYPFLNFNGCTVEV